MSQPSTTFSAKRAFLHALIPIALMAIAVGIVAATGMVKDARRFGEGVGRFGAIVLLVSIGISYLIQTGRKRAAWWVGGGATAAIAAVTGVVIAIGTRAGPILSATERSDLIASQVAGATWLRHPTLGFSLRHPGEDFEPSGKIAQELFRRRKKGQQRSQHAWGYQRNKDLAAVIVHVAKGIGRTEESVEGFLKGLRSAAKRSGRGKVVSERIDWPRREARLYLLIDDAFHVKHRSRAGRFGNAKTPFLITVITIARDPNALSSIRASLRLPAGAR